MARLRTGKYDNVNLLRAVAALAVVVYHVIEHGRWEEVPRDGALGYLRLGWLGVDLFFVISGFVIAYSALILYRQGREAFPREYWRRRLSRILPLYFLTLFSWVALVWGASAHWTAPDWAWQLFTHVAFIHNFFAGTHGMIDGPNWSLAVEMQFYLLVALLIGWIDRTPGWRIWLYGVAISLAWRACMFALYAGDVPLLFVKTTQLPGTLDEFGAGIFLAKWVLDGRPRLPLNGLAMALAAALAGYAAMALYWPNAEYWSFASMVIAWRSALSVFLFFLVGAAVALPQVVGHRWLRPLHYLGEISYGIYLWHLFAVYFVVLMLGWRGPAALAYVLVLTLAAAALSWRYFEKPIMDAARARPKAQ